MGSVGEREEARALAGLSGLTSTGATAGNPAYQPHRLIVVSS
ncbi:hypothetical protein HEP84_58355 [Streptomyces sp. RLB1-33]|nr:hypothetical protein [Streptomyces sp. RLB1-33]